MSEPTCVARMFEGIRAPGCQCRECLRKEVANQKYFNLGLEAELTVWQERVEELLEQRVGLLRRCRALRRRIIELE